MDTVKRFLTYSPPQNENIRFWIIPSIENEITETFSEYVEIEQYDVFLLFTSASCNKQLLPLQRIIKNRNKPVFFVQILQGDAKSENLPNQFSHMRLEKFASEVYRIDIHQQDEYDFYKLTKAIADVLPSPKKECFNQIPKIGELFAIHRFKDFVKGKICIIFFFQLYDGVSLVYCQHFSKKNFDLRYLEKFL